MHREWVDRSAHEDGLLQRWDPRLKVGLTLATLLLLALGTRNADAVGAVRLAGVLVLVGGLAIAAGVPLRSWVLRSSIVLPFALFVALGRVIQVEPGDSWLPMHWEMTVREGGPAQGLLVLARAWISVAVTLLLVLTTPLPAVLGALERWHVPRGFLAACSLVYRYLWVLVDEGKRLLLARRLRGARRAAWRDGARIVATLFARGLARAERVEIALRLRGFDGRFIGGRPFAWSGSDTRVLVVATVLLVGICLGSSRLAGGGAG